MDLSKILSIAGKPGLYKLAGEAKNNLVVESLTDGKRMPAFAHERISSLQEISIYTTGEDLPLHDALKMIFDSTGGQPVENPKKLSSNQLKSLFEKAIPDYDKDSVYVSDMKKVFTWYNLLLEKGLLDFSEEEESDNEENNKKEQEDQKTTEENEKTSSEDKK
ncbi:DUF5606 domain-containing protein [Candidatus Sulfidibacterium hydrothermale]|uniref:DUF5606 family protein n=1 Tax=Candidatus Sulfidibacterium hydrothermale TaxID=2875962 RepID=UPI001F0ADE2A|nr:DUF5606 domain-containing protein [Candidatus Sulfidibacterium hydrothermale]UBM63251.1 DUF5606 domain-containing protein [Candidatus Sulfidibacterium hydrothermale]